MIPQGTVITQRTHVTQLVDRAGAGLPVGSPEAAAAIERVRRIMNPDKPRGPVAIELRARETWRTEREG